jgi:restriction system protein
VVRDLYGTLLHEEAQRAYLITTGGLTRQAVDWAAGKPIVLYDGAGLVRLIRRTKAAKSKNSI